jgi:hypothetical protein
VSADDLDEEGRSTKSGAAGRRRAREKAEAAEEAASPDDGAWAEEFKSAGAPDLENPGQDLDYVRKLQLIALKQMVTTPKPTPRQRECWRSLKEMSAVVGMTSNRAQLEAKVKKLEAALKQRADTGNNIARVESGAKVKRPPTARGAAPPGPRAIPPDALPPDEPTK